MTDAIEVLTTPSQTTPALRDGPAVHEGAADHAAMLKAARDVMRKAEKPAEPVKAAAATEKPAESLAEGTEAEGVADAAADDAGSLAEETAKTDEAKAKPAEKTKPEAQDGAPNLRGYLKRKVDAQAAREQSEAAARSIEAEAQSRAQRMIQDAHAQAEKHIRDALEEFRSKPLDVARKYGVDLDGALAQKADEADPMVQLRREFAGHIGEVRKVVDSQAEHIKALTSQLESSQREAVTEKAAAAQNKFVQLSEDGAFKFARKLWSSPEKLLAEAHGIIQEARSAYDDSPESKRPNARFKCPDAEVLTVLNERARDYFKSNAAELRQLLQEVEGEAEPTPEADEKPKEAVAKAPVTNGNGKPKTNGKAPAGAGQGPRTLSAQTGSERRAPPEPTEKELSDKEYRELAVKKALEFRAKS